MTIPKMDIALHEAGHAVVTKALRSNFVTIEELTIENMENDERNILGVVKAQYTNVNIKTHEDKVNNIASLLAGIIAVKMYGNKENANKGEKDDIKKAKSEAISIILDEKPKYISDPKLSFRALIGERYLTEKEREELNCYVEEVMCEAKEIAKDVLENNRSRLFRIQEQLLEKGTLHGNDIDAIFQEIQKNKIEQKKKKWKGIWKISKR